MPLTGPRPNPSQRLSIANPDTPPYESLLPLTPSHAAPSYGLAPPTFVAPPPPVHSPASPPPLQAALPCARSPSARSHPMSDSGMPAPDPAPRTLGSPSAAEEMRERWVQRNSYPPAGGYDDPSDPDPTHAHRAYAEAATGARPAPAAGAGPGAGDYLDPYAPSIGPWDSASQRSASHPNSYPSADYVANPYPSSRLGGAPGDPYSVPLASDGGGTHVGRRQSTTAISGLSYVDEDGHYHRSAPHRPSVIDEEDPDALAEQRGLLPSAGAGAGPSYEKFDLEAPPAGVQAYRGPNRLYDALLFPTGLDRLLALVGIKHGRYPLEQAIERKRRGIGGQRWPVAAWALALAMTGVMIYEMVRNYHFMGTPIAIHPSFNYMIGPSSEVLINVGARFPPCMKYVSALPPTFELACLNDTSNPPTTSCTIEEICGHGGFPDDEPNQSWRFVAPIFMHVGIIHLLVNMLAQITAGAQVEREMGTLPFLIVYFAGGIYGFVLGGNFSRSGIPSAGASGALFATNACVLVDLLLHWKYEERPKLKAFLLAVEFVIGIAIGYIPNAVDGLAHLGGFAMGLLCGVVLYPSISETRTHRLVVWALRAAAVPLAVVAFYLTVRNFYTPDPNAACEWCRYLSCIPTSANDDCTGTGITTYTTTSNATRRWEL
ncbi:hypothetical protein Q5752_002782 [Cryptotrichosporon argae]